MKKRLDYVGRLTQDESATNLDPQALLNNAGHNGEPGRQPRLFRL